MQDSYDEFLYGSGDGGASTSASQRQRGAPPPGSGGPPQAALPPLPSAIPSIAPSLSNGIAPLRLPALSTAQPMSSSSHSPSHQPRPRTRGESSPVLAATSPYRQHEHVNPFDRLPSSSGSVHSPGLGERFDSEALIVTRPPHPQRHNSRGSTDLQTSSNAPSSKSVLTVALQRAQSAVLLDSANNYPSAIAAYSQAVRLLKEVMARVEDGSREMERKLSDAGTAPRVGESEDDWERRRAKYERKEKAKLDEARRLRVIHDTYEDRIRMLVQMGTPLPPPSPSFGSASSFPSTSASSLDTFERATNHDRQPSSPLDPHRPLASHPYAYDSGAAATPRTAAFAALQDGDGQGIGAAMLQLGQASHVTEPVLARLPVVHDGSDVDRLSAFRAQQPRRPLSFASDSTAIAVAGGGAATPTSPPLPSPIPLSPLDPMLSLGAVASSAGERARTSAGGLPDIASNASDDATVQPAILERNRDESTVQPTQHGAAPAMRRGQSFGGDVAFRPHAETRPTEMLRGYSTGSIVPVRRGSSISALAFVEEGGAPVDIRPRPTRNASLVNPTTQDGTISQRRNQQGLPEAVVRAPSTETERPVAIDDFGRPRDSAKHESWATTTGSLPARLRSVSTSTGTGSRRPRLPPFEEMPSPSLGAAPAPGGHRTTLSGSSSASGPPSRKSSVPTPTSLGAPSIGAASNGPPSLGRSPSASSIGSSASSSYPRRRTRPSFSGHASSQSVSSSGVYLSAGLANHPPPDATSREATLAIHPARRPFHLMRLVLSTMPPSAGGYVSEKLFIPAQIWTTSAGAKLVALETKVRMLDLLATGLDALERAGRGLLLVPTASASARAVARQEADRFARELDGFEGLTEGAQSTLARKSVSSAVEPKTGRKGSTASFASWSSKLSQSLNRVTNGSSLDSQAAYVEAIAKVLKQAQFLDEHFALILPQPSLAADDGPYALLERATRQQLERSLRRTSDFFGQVLCRFVLQDVGVLLDKYVKRGGAWLSAD